MAGTRTRLTGYLLGRIPEIGPDLARTLVQDAWEKICRNKDNWSFLAKESAITVPNAVSDGTVTFTQDSDQVLADGTAKAALDVLDQLLVGRIIRRSAGTPYEITAYSSTTGYLTLALPYYEDTEAGAAYEILGIYVTPPANFQGWISGRDVENQVDLSFYNTRQEIDFFDPERTDSDVPYALFQAGYTEATRQPRYEFYPWPTVRRRYPVLYQQTVWELTDAASGSLPPIIPDVLLKSASLLEGYTWAESRRNTAEPLAGGDWRFLIDRERKVYQGLLQEADIADQNIAVTNIGENYLWRSRGLGRGANWLQSHSLPPQ